MKTEWRAMFSLRREADKLAGERQETMRLLCTNPDSGPKQHRRIIDDRAGTLPDYPLRL
jgi:hypothetical protein